jgi:hypothetical protein
MWWFMKAAPQPVNDDEVSAQAKAHRGRLTGAAARRFGTVPALPRTFVLIHFL